MPRRWLVPAALVGALAVLATAAGCDGAARAGAGVSIPASAAVSRPAGSPTSASVTSPTPTPTSSSTSAPASAPTSSSTPAAMPGGAVTSPSPVATASSGAVAAPFTATVRTVTAADLGASWHAGCPVAPAQLREISLSYWGFDNASHVGRIVVDADVVAAVETVFKTLYLQRFPIRSMRPVSDFGGSDDASMAADNTSGFNCRNAVAQGPPRWSAHAYGKAIDVNTVENPYLEGGNVLPPAGAPFASRSPYRPGMAVPGGQLVTAFAAVGWRWGGRWADPDYQHFSSTGG